MRIIGPAEDRAELTTAADPALTADAPPSQLKPATGSTGFTDYQQAALYNSRKARRQRLGVVPQPSLP
jgi:hypothetical protein